MITKADRDADAAILAAATRGTWITVLPSSQEGGVQLAGFGPTRAAEWSTATSLRVGGTDSNTEERFAKIAVAAVQMTMEQHAANAKAAAHAVNRLPEYIAELNAIEEEVVRFIEDVRGEIAAKRDPGASKGYLDFEEGQIDALEVVLGMLRKSEKKQHTKRGGQ